ncbi:hypothetical protein [Streptomyces lushanensis]|uniref:hypothetical protein n=1 Tax=Streptomyces lushanensis TaxID=1434255 RepID=UPI00114CC4F9|nr:hypothetical protein [Streptomyces lushanensis]
MTVCSGYGLLFRMRNLVRQLEDVARLLDDVGPLPPLTITFTHDPDDGPYAIVATPNQLKFADQRLAADQVAARLQVVLKVGEVLTGRYGAWVRGRWAVGEHPHRRYHERSPTDAGYA